MKKRRTGPEGVGTSAAQEPDQPQEAGGPEPEAEHDADMAADDGPAETEDGRYVADSELMEALRALKVRRDRNRDLTIGIGCGILGLVVGLVIGNVTSGSGSAAAGSVSPAVAASRGDLPDATNPPAQGAGTTNAQTSPSASDATVAGTVTFSVTGHASGGVLISYGTNSTGSQSAKLPFTGSMPLDGSGGVLYYDVYAQLHGSGSLTCSVAVNGKVIKTGTATTASNICSAQIAQDPATGQWQSE